MSSDFLPKDYKLPQNNTDFMKFEEGDNKIRILTPALVGWEGWKDGKPFRRKGVEQNIEEDEVDVDEKFKKPKMAHFWAFVVWNYEEKKIMLLSLTQKSIMKVIENLVNDEEWGDPTKYDITIIKTVKGGKTTYSVKSSPMKAISEEAQEAFEETKIDLESLIREPGDDSDMDFSGKGSAKKGKK